MIFAIDSGGTKTEILLADENGTVTARSVIGGFGTADDPADRPIPMLTQTLNQMNRDGHEITDVIVNLGGKNTAQFTQVIHTAYPRADVHVFRESSGVIGDYMREKCGADIVIFCGTGIIALAKGKAGCFVLDGWGRDIGDHGSGYDAGLSAIRRSLTELEGTAPLSLLAKKITGEEEPFGLSASYEAIMKKRDAVRARILPLDRQKTAALAKTVSECAKRGDTAALAILQSVGDDFASTVIRACRQIGKSDVKTAFFGGMTKTKEYWLPVMMQKLTDAKIKAEIMFPNGGFAEGALKYCMEKRGYDNDNSI